MNITCITYYPSGFICSGDNLFIFVYKYTHD